MKRITAFVLIFLMASCFVYAQETLTHVEKTRFGVGISFGKEPYIEYEMGLPMGLLDFPTFYLPIQLNPTFRFEPEFGLLRYKESNGADETFQVMVLGAGLFYTKWYGKCGLYFGGRFQMFKWSQEYTYEGDSDKITRTDTMFGPAIGGECWCCQHISFGGELQLNIISMGNWKNGNDHDDSTSIMKFKGLFFIRWWF